MTLKGGRLEFLAPHYLRSQVLRPGFVRLSLRLGAAQQMPPWAKLQFTNAGVSASDLNRVLGRIASLESWVDEWESLGRHHEQGGQDALALGKTTEAARRFLAASAAYNFAQYVIFLNIERKRTLHQSCVRAYANAAPLFETPAERFEVMFRRHAMCGFLRVPKVRRPAPVVVLFNGTNAVKEELHWWAEALLEKGLATLVFDGPGLGSTFHRLSMVAEPRPVGAAILDRIESRPDLDPGAVAFFGMSLGGYMAIRMASHDPRIRATAAISPPFSADVYWNLTLASMRRELAALYNMEEREMGAAIDRITLTDVIARVRCPLLLAAGGHDLITPDSESVRIFEGARCERELLYYPKGAHDCFNVLDDLRPRVVSWMDRKLRPHRSDRSATPAPRGPAHPDLATNGADWMAGEAVDSDFADALMGEQAPRNWNGSARTAGTARSRGWPWSRSPANGVHLVRRFAQPLPAEKGSPLPPLEHDAPEALGSGDGA